MGREAQTKTRFAAVAKERGVSYERFAEAVIEVGASRRTASRYWAGDTLPRVPELAAICRLLQVTADYFAELIDEPLGIGGLSAPAAGAGAASDPVKGAKTLRGAGEKAADRRVTPTRPAQREGGGQDR